MAHKKKSFFESQGWKNFMKYLYGLGAAVVIMGALFKILHWPFASEMLIVGLSTEAAIFAISAFEPLPHEDAHYDWTKVYPQLKESDSVIDDEEDELDEQAVTPFGFGQPQTLRIDDAALDAANKALTPELFENLSTSIKGLKKGVDNLTEMSDISVNTSEFGTKVKTAAGNVEQLANTASGASQTMKDFNISMGEVKKFQDTVNAEVKNYSTALQAVNKNLSSLNGVYELELQDAQKHINSVKNFYGSISNVMQNLLDTSKDTEALRQEVSSLSKNMSSLNTIYGNMLTAMSGGAKK